MRDPSAPLPPAPDPWAASEMPPFRSRPPYLMTEMIAAEPAFAERLIRRLNKDAALDSLVEVLRKAAKKGEPILTTGCGTSEHAAMAIAGMLADALDLPTGREPRSMQALEGLRSPAGRGVLIGVSHEGGTAATNAALRSAQDAGATTALVTVSSRGPGVEHADLVIETEEQDQSWCHTIGYLSPVLVGMALTARLRDQKLDGRAVRAILDATDDHRAIAAVVPGLTGIDRVIVAGLGADLITARELALKISEGARLPATAQHIETLHHGHLAAATRWTGLVVIATDQADVPPAALERTASLLRAAFSLAMPAAAILGDAAARGIDRELTAAGRIVLPRPSRVPAAAAPFIAPVIPFQLLTERLARARGVNPDTLGREDAAQAAAHAP